MEISKLSENLQSQLRSDLVTYSISNCVIELVENSIDANAANIAVRINFKKFHLEVVDDGVGLTKEQLEVIGQRYCTSKCKKKNFGYRGEAIASIRKVSSKLTIISKFENEGTFCKVFEGSTANILDSLYDRKVRGTTVIVENILGNVPVRQRCIKSFAELQSVKKFIQATALMFPKVNFTLRDDTNDPKKVILDIRRTNSTTIMFMNLFPNAIQNPSSIMKLAAESGRIAIKALISKEVCHSNELQFVFINNQYIPKSEIDKHLNKLLSHSFYFKDSSKEKNFCKPIYILKINCPREDYNITFQPNKRHIEFKNWERIKNCLLKIADRFEEKDTTESVKQIDEPKKQETFFLPQFAFDKLNNAHTVFGLPAKRKIQKSLKMIETESNLSTDHEINKFSSRKSDLIAENKSNNSNKQQTNLIPVSPSSDILKSNYPDQNNSNDEPQLKIVSPDQVEAVVDELKSKEYAWIWNLPKSSFECRKFKNKEKRRVIPHIVRAKNAIHCVQNQNANNYFKKKDCRMSKKTGCFFKDYNQMDNVISRYGNIKKKAKLRNQSCCKKYSNDVPSIQCFNKEYNSDENKNESNVQGLCKNLVKIINYETRDEGLSQIFPNKRISKEKEKKILNLKQHEIKKDIFPIEIQQNSPTEIHKMDVMDYKSKVAEWISKLPDEPEKILENYNTSKMIDDFEKKTKLTINSKGYGDPQTKKDSPVQLFNFNTNKSEIQKDEKDGKPLQKINFKWTLQRKKDLMKEDFFNFESDIETRNSKKKNIIEISNERNNLQENETTKDSPANLDNLAKNTKNSEEIYDFQNASLLSQKSSTCPYNCQCRCHKNSSSENILCEIQNFQSSGKNDSIKQTSVDELEINSELIKTLPIERDEELKTLPLQSNIDVAGDISQPKSLMDVELFPTDPEDVDLFQTFTFTEKINEFEADSNCNSKYFKNDFDEFDKLKFKLKSRFLASSSVEDIPKGMMQIKPSSSKIDKLSEKDRQELVALVKPYSMQNHITLDDNGNSCIRIFPFLKKSSEVLEHSDPQEETEDLNCWIKIIKADLTSFKFIAQIENKFILICVTIENSNEILILLDQHAIDERIRVEKLLKEYIKNGQWLSTPINPPIHLNVPPHSHSSLFSDFQSNFEELGLFYEINAVLKDKMVVSFVKVPTCFYNRASREKHNFQSCLQQLIESLVKEMFKKFSSQGTLVHTVPKELQNIVNYEACRGAVKFGDRLTSEICETLVKELSQCNLPFQCAHGRPSLIPLVNLDKLKHLERKVWKPSSLNVETIRR